MVDFTNSDLLILAQISSLKLDKHEVSQLQQQLQKTIDYTHKLDQFQMTVEHEAVKNINVFREDKVIQKDSAPLLSQAPKTTKTYFVVPKILEKK